MRRNVNRLRSKYKPLVDRSLLLDRPTLGHFYVGSGTTLIKEELGNENGKKGRF